MEKKRYRIIALVMIVMCFFSLIGCGKGADASGYKGADGTYYLWENGAATSDYLTVSGGKIVKAKIAEAEEMFEEMSNAATKIKLAYSGNVKRDGAITFIAKITATVMSVEVTVQTKFSGTVKDGVICFTSLSESSGVGGAEEHEIVEYWCMKGKTPPSDGDDPSGNDDPSGDVADKDQTLTVWADDDLIDSYVVLADEWQQSDSKYSNWTIKFEVHAAGDAADIMSYDPSAGADVFFFESGSIKRLLQNDVLQQLDVATTQKIVGRDGMNATMVMDDGRAWAFPANANNGYFLWYDKTFFTAEDVRNLDAMLEKINRYNDLNSYDQKYFNFRYDSGWYEASWFFGTGCEMDRVGNTDNYYTNIHTSPEGLAAGAASVKYLAHPAIVSVDDRDVAVGFGNGAIVAAVCGTWLEPTLKNAFQSSGRRYEDVMAAAKLPTFTAQVSGITRQYQMGSFMNGLCCGVNRRKTNRAKIDAAMALADYFTGEKGQLEAYRETNAVPTNKTLANSAEVKSNMAIRALMEQNEAGGYTQKEQSGLWDAMGAFGSDCKNGLVRHDDLRNRLKTLAEEMAGQWNLVTSKSVA